MKITESFIQGKFNDETRCEDGFVVTKDYAAVIDGSTSKRAHNLQKSTETKQSDGISGGRFAMEHICEAIKHLPAEATMEQAARFFTEVLRREMSEEAECSAALRPTCSAVVFSRVHREVWLFGDCQCRFLGKTHTNPKLVDEILTKARCEAVEYLLAHGKTPDDIRRFDAGRAFIYDALRDQTNFQNDTDGSNPYRYTVIDGMPMDLDTIPVLSVGKADTLILASDGYPILCDTLKQTEQELQRLLRQDPLCIHENAATKCLMDGQVSFDDRTFLSLEL